VRNSVLAELNPAGPNGKQLTQAAADDCALPCTMTQGANLRATQAGLQVSVGRRAAYRSAGGTWRISRLARTQLIILLAMLDGALCVPSLALAAISKYQVPAASPAIVYVVAVGLVIVID
jgi:hypothetical protein